jgi:hypothetical protein
MHPAIMTLPLYRTLKIEPMFCFHVLHKQLGVREKGSNELTLYTNKVNTDQALWSLSLHGSFLSCDVDLDFT